MRQQNGWCTMKILVLSDSHSALRFMRACIETIKPDWIIHLGDFYEDGQVMAQEYPEIPMVQVPGNCDRYRMVNGEPEILVTRIDGVNLYLTHGHLHGVKMTLGNLLREAGKCGVQAVLYGHTHIADCHQEKDGLWVLNPGSCNYSGGSVGLMETKDGKILSCRILERDDLEV